MDFTAREGNFFRSNACQADDDGGLVKQKPSSVSGLTGVHSNESGCFDCNICLDTAQDPIVTLCGHLFCWPCIYRWLHIQTSAVSPNQRQNCPVCKANISISSLVPLYGRGMSSSDLGQKKQIPENMLIPRRPTPSVLNNLLTSASTLNQGNQHHHHRHQSHQQYFPQHYGGFTAMGSSGLATAVMTSFLSPVIGMFGDMVYPRIFGTYTNTFTHPYQTTYSFTNQRIRRQEMQLDKSLHRVSIFLLCCIVLCLLLF